MVKIKPCEDQYLKSISNWKIYFFCKMFVMEKSAEIQRNGQNKVSSTIRT